MPSAYPAPGDHIGRFRIVAQLGAGGMGVVYSAVEENLSRNVALKVISPQFADDPDFRARFSSEARALASLDSTYVVQVFAHGEEDGYLYIATQLIPDGDLGKMLQAQGSPPIAIAVRLMEQVASGLSDAHDVGLVHRDIKPGNVLVRRRGVGMQAYLGDFGIARRVDAEATRVGGPAIGTPSYMAPELHTGSVANISTDVYALGCLLWVTLTGAAPYPGHSEFEIVTGHMGGAVPQLTGSAPMVLAVNRILRLSMAKQPNQRYPSAALLRDDLQAALRLPDDSSVGQARGFATGAPTHVSRGTPTPTPTPAAPGGHGGQYYPPPVGAPFYGPSGGAATRPGRRSKAPLWIALAGVAALLVGFGIAAAITFAGSNGGGGGGGGETEEDFASGTADEIVTAAEKDMLVLDSVHIDGEADVDGEPATFDVTVTSSGDCGGELGAGSGVAELRSVGGETWFRPDRAFWEQFAGPGSADLILSQIGDDWVLLDKADAQDIADFCDLDELLEGDGGEPELAKDGTDAVDGQSVVKVTAAEDTGDTTSYISVDAPHYILKLESGDEGNLTFSEFDATFDVTAPADDEVTDLDNLQ